MIDENIERFKDKKKYWFVQINVNVSHFLIYFLITHYIYPGTHIYIYIYIYIYV